ncbi:hypothetical protein [Aquiflexum sp.]|uniref:hypothetical protein n=1 Tax=Aquiflexum sp. TaxID=1872584 RepID=UPI0035937B61
MEIKEAVSALKENGRIKIKDGKGTIMELIEISKWDAAIDDWEGIFLFFDLFQIRSVAEPFSDVSLDIIEFASKPTIYHTPINRVLKTGPINEGMVKFAVIRKDFWNRLLFAYSQPLILQYVKSENFDFETREYFPLLSAGTKEIFLSPDGDIRILKA